MLSGQTAVITGGAQGLGFAIAERYVAEGARVVLGDLDIGATEAATERLGGDTIAAAVKCDAPRPPTSIPWHQPLSRGSVGWTSW